MFHIWILITLYLKRVSITLVAKISVIYIHSSRKEIFVQRETQIIFLVRSSLRCDPQLCLNFIEKNLKSKKV